MSSDPIISVVMPFYNEGAVITQTVQETVKHLSLCCSQFEILCIDDGSTDLGPEHVTRLSTTHPEVQLIRLSRNFCKEAALAAGLELPRRCCRYGCGYATSLVAHHGGSMAGRPHAGSGKPDEKRIRTPPIRFCHHRLAGLATDRNLVGDVDFKLLDRQVAVAINQRRNARYFRGLVAWVGFASKVAFDVPPRLGGQTKWGFPDSILCTQSGRLFIPPTPYRGLAGLYHRCWPHRVQTLEITWRGCC